MSFLTVLILSVVFMYMVLAAQFESFIHPITILLSLPITVPFAVFSLWVLGVPFTIYSILGLFLLLVIRGNEQVVFVATDGHARLRKLTLGERRDSLIEVLDGVIAGDSVIVSGQFQLADGKGVTIAGENAAQPIAMRTARN